MTERSGDEGSEWLTPWEGLIQARRRSSTPYRMSAFHVNPLKDNIIVSLVNQTQAMAAMEKAAWA